MLNSSLYLVAKNGNVEQATAEQITILRKRLKGIESLAREGGDSGDPRVTHVAFQVIAREVAALSQMEVA